MGARYGAAVAGGVALLALIVLVVTWPDAGHPDDTHVDAGEALAPAIEPQGPEEPEPAIPPTTTLAAAPPSTIAPPSAPTPPTSVPFAPMETSASPPLTADESYAAANALVSALAQQRTRIEAQLADATRRGDTRTSARLTEQRDRLSTSLVHAESLLEELEAQRDGDAPLAEPGAAAAPADEAEIPPGP